MKRGTGIAVLVAIAAALTGCGNSSSSGASAGKTSTAGKVSTAAGSTDTASTTSSAGGASGAANSSSGGSGSDSAAVTKTMKTYISAVADGDGATACGQLSRTASQQLVTAASSAGYKTCGSAVHMISAKLPASTKKLLHDAQVVDVHVNGRGASAKFKGGSRAARLRKSGGRWYIAGGFAP